MTAADHPVLDWAAARDVPLDTYAAAIVRFARTDGTSVAVEGQGLDGVDAIDGPRTALGADVVEVLTGWNPNSEQRPREVNDRANARLREQLADAVPDAVVLDAVGSSPDGSWSEPGFAVLDADVTAVLALARAFGQHATYRWTEARHDRPAGWSLVACDLPDQPLALPARLVAVDDPPGR